jgi:PAT family beta-lactamase induction signal transducer AmpG
MPSASNRPTPTTRRLAATYQTGYRLAMIWAGAGVLWPRAPPAWQARAAAGADTRRRLADGLPGDGGLHAGGHGHGAVLARARPVELPRRATRPNGCAARWWSRLPTLRRYRWQAALILALIAVYRISDVVMGIMANPFYVDMGYTKDEVAAVTKVYGVVMTLVGAFVGGSLAMRWA